MPIKMIVTDLDGTLLRTDKTISEYSAMILRRCHDKGIRIAFATARPIRTLADLIIDFPKDAAIYHNGAVIEVDGEIYRQIGIPHETTEKLLLQAVEQLSGVRISVEINDILYANFDVTKVWTNTTATMSDFADLPDLPADKIIFSTSEKQVINKIRELLSDDFYSEITENQHLMVMNKNARKINAVNEIAECFSVSISDIVAFGDDYNDIEMLRRCGIGVAVKNAIEEAQNAADYICETNDNDGVAKWLEEHVLPIVS